MIALYPGLCLHNIILKLLKKGIIQLGYPLKPIKIVHLTGRHKLVRVRLISPITCPPKNIRTPLRILKIRTEINASRIMVRHISLVFFLLIAGNYGNGEGEKSQTK